MSSSCSKDTQTDLLLPVSEFTDGDFTDYNIVAEGGEAIVYAAEHTIHGKVGIKVFKSPEVKCSVQEIETLMKVICHQNIVRILGFFYSKEVGKTMRSGYVMEFMPFGSLWAVIHNTSIEYDEKQMYSWILQASRGIAYLHAQKILHRDVKPDNMLLGKNIDDLKLSDFGMAKQSAVTNETHTKGVGTIIYMAPEVIQGDPTTKYTFPADVYSFGISAWEIFHRKKPFYEHNSLSQYELCGKIVNGKRPKIEVKLEGEMKTLILHSLKMPSTLRPAITEFITLTAKLLQKQERGTSAEENSPAGLVRSASQRFKRLFFSAPVLSSSLTPIGEEKKMTLLLGGEIDELHYVEDQINNIILSYEHDTKTWKELDIRMPYYASESGAAVLDGDLYVFGGRLSYYHASQAMYKLDLKHGEWIRRADLPEERYGICYSSVAYKGKIYVIGGKASDGKARNTVFAYDTAENVWSKLTNVKEGWNIQAAAVYNNKLYFFGDNAEIGFHIDAGYYDIALNKWTYLPLSCPRENGNFFAALPFKNEMVFLGSDKKVFSSDVIEGEKDSCKKLPSMSRCKINAAVFVCDEAIVVAGGIKRSGFYMGYTSNSVETFNGKSWKNEQRLPFNLKNMCCVTVEGDFGKYLVSDETRKAGISRSLSTVSTSSVKGSPVYTANHENKVTLLLGGFRENSQEINTILSYEHKTKSWKELDLKLPHDVWGHGAVVLDGELYVIGGCHRLGVVYVRGTFLFKLDRETKSWKKLAGLPRGRDCISTRCVAYRGKIYVIGGRDFDLKFQNTVFTYDPFDDTWTELANLEITFPIHSAIVYRDKIYVLGKNFRTPIFVTYYDITQNKWINWILNVNPPQLGDSFNVVVYKEELFFRGESGKIFVTNFEGGTGETCKKLPSMRFDRSDAAIFTSGDSVIAAGGNDYHTISMTGSMNTNSVECFNGTTWNKEHYMPYCVHRATTVTVSGCLAKYILES